MSINQLHPYTEIINKKQKLHSHSLRRKTLQWLAKKFPKAFDTTENIHPLKKGIMEDILKFADEASQEGISKSKLREALVIYTRRLDYLTALKSQEMRIDLEGNPVTEVTVAEAEKAAMKIKKQVDKNIKNLKIKSQDSQPVSNYYKDPIKSYHADSFTPVKNKPKEVIIKHKSTRQYDPDMVLKLKEKLGISRTKETV